MTKAEAIAILKALWVSKEPPYSEEDIRTALDMAIESLTPKKPTKMIPCICGCNRREHWNSYNKGVWTLELRCKRCGRSATGHTEEEVKKNWNRMVINSV